MPTATSSARATKAKAATARVRPAVKRTIPAKRTPAAVPSEEGCGCGAGPCHAACPPEEAFWINNGPVLDTLCGLMESFSAMTDEQFAYHTKRDGNDFARWVRESIGDPLCAARLERAKTRAAAAKALAGLCRCGA